MFGNEKKEFGDYQTPIDFCLSICDYIKKYVLTYSPKEILEPTCGIGNFLYAAANTFDCNNICGVEINADYAKEAKQAVPIAKITVGDIFNFDTRKTCQESDVLIIGNPPWATNSNLLYNLPKKINFKGLKGIDALTGSSNFDICEYIILKILDEYRDTNSAICMLCKTSVARNVILEMSRNKFSYQNIEILNFDSKKIFGISAAACVLIIKLSSHITDAKKIICQVKDFESQKVLDTLTVLDGVIKTSNDAANLEGKCQMTWRQGVKHDCSKVMELDFKEAILSNKNKEIVNIEDTLIFPLVKSSHFKRPIIQDFSKFVIVTQTKPKQDTSYIQSKLPLTWKYLTDHIENFNNRKSVIYKNSPPFSMFGIGDYSFAQYKVALSGFYKKPLFSLLHSNKPVMIDDTAYFLAFDNYENAYCMMLLLNSDTVQKFLLSIAFLDNKRPYTVKLLSRLDLKKCIKAVSFDEIKQTEIGFSLNNYITLAMFNKFKLYINSLE